MLYLKVTPRSRFLPEKLTCPQLVNKFSAFYGTRSFITAFTSVSPPVHILRQISSVHAPPSTPWRHVLILSSLLRLGLPSGLLPSGLPTKTLYTALLFFFPSKKRVSNLGAIKTELRRQKWYPLRTFPTILVITLSELDVMVPCVSRIGQSV